MRIEPIDRILHDAEALMVLAEEWWAKGEETGANVRAQRFYASATYFALKALYQQQSAVIELLRRPQP